MGLRRSKKTSDLKVPTYKALSVGRWQQSRLRACAEALNQVSLLTLMVGNLLEKSLALAAILTATWRATAL